MALAKLRDDMRGNGAWNAEVLGGIVGDCRIILGGLDTHSETVEVEPLVKVVARVISARGHDISVFRDVKKAEAGLLSRSTR
jgi:hypothetical protein